MKKPTSASLAKQIRNARKLAGQSQAQFARKIGVRQQKLSEWENGKRLRAVCDAMALLDVLKGGAA